MKKFISLLMSLVLLFSFCVSAESAINVNLDGKILIFDEYPINESGRTLVPLRKIFEELGATVSWDSSSKTAVSEKDGITIKIQIDNADMHINGKVKTLDVPARLINGRTFVPARAVAEAFGCGVEWNGTNSTVIIKSKDYIAKEASFFKYESEKGYIISYFPDYTLKTSDIYGTEQSDFLLTDPDSLSSVNVTAIKNTSGNTSLNDDYLKQELEKSLGVSVDNYNFNYRNYMPSVSYEYKLNGITVKQTIYFTNSYVYTVTLALTQNTSEETAKNLEYTMYSLNI